MLGISTKRFPDVVAYPEWGVAWVATRHPERPVPERGDQGVIARFDCHAESEARRRWTQATFPEHSRNFVRGDAAKGSALREQAAGFLRLRMWGIDADERHSNALAPGDLVLIYLGAPEREFIGRAELASAVPDWTPSEAQVYPGDSAAGVSLAQVEEWDPPVPMKTVLSHIDPAENAKADFQAGVVRITANEYETALAVAAGRAPSTG